MQRLVLMIIVLVATALSGYFTSPCDAQTKGKRQKARTETPFQRDLAKAQRGDSNKMLEVGFYYYKGKDNITKDIEKAKYWFNKAIEAGNAEAYGWMAVLALYEDEDNESYIKWLRQGIAHNSGKCYEMLYINYKSGGHGLPEDKAMAGALLLRGGELRLPDVFQWLCYAYGSGFPPKIPKDTQKAIFWGKRAMDDLYAETGLIHEGLVKDLSDLGCDGYEPAMYTKEYVEWLKGGPEPQSLSSSTSKSRHNSSTSKSSTAISYHYTKSGRGQSQNTGQWTDAMASEECEVQFSENGITVNGIYYPYVRTSGAWKVYGGSSMGWGGTSTTFYYYVDGNKNMKQVCESYFPYGSDTFVYPMSRNGDPTPIGRNSYDGGGSMNRYGSDSDNGSTSTIGQSSGFKCAYCNGTGRIERNDNAPASYGQSRANKKCSECGRTYDPTVFNHYHIQCRHCGGTGKPK